MSSGLPLLQRNRHNQQDPFSSVDDNASMISSDSETGAFGTASVVNGIETVISTPSRRAASDQLVLSRHHGALQERNIILDEFSNKTLPPEDMELMMRRMEKRADEKQKRSYTEGLPKNEVDENAPVLKIGLTFLAGADMPQVARAEQISMTSPEPNQRDASWRVNTAGTLLTDIDITEDLWFVKHDRTQKIATKIMDERDRNGSKKKKGTRAQDQVFETVTIDSDEVRIVNDLRGNAWDIECTLIEIDSTSFTNLIFNYKEIVDGAGGPDMSFERTRDLLNTMIEDARRLCARSPILFRMSTRTHIINSKNTRYGINQGHIFQTLTTSQGIKEIIHTSASYYNSLNPISGSDTSQVSIKPQFLQMIVLMLSLLNDRDLAEIKEFLEATYGLKADRADLELLFLKVIPLMSINSKVFLKAMVSAIEGWPLNQHNNKEEAHYWRVFIQRILKQGYILPGTIENLGHEWSSWIVKWPEQGFNSTLVFNHLQYAGRMRTMNDIPPIEFHPEARLSEVTVQLTTGALYNLSPGDLDMITCLNPGRYMLWEAVKGGGGRNYDLEICEEPLNDIFEKAVRNINRIIRHVNNLLTNPNKTSGISSVFKGRAKEDFKLFNDFVSSGRCTRSRVLLDHDVLAMAYKLGGRKYARRDALRAMSNDTNRLKYFIRHFEKHASDVTGKIYSQQKRELKEGLESINGMVSQAEEQWKKVRDIDDISEEPISRVIYPGSSHTVKPTIWNNYTARYTEGDGILHLEAQHYVVNSVVWISAELIEIRLDSHPSKFHVTPLQHVNEGERDDEIQVDDPVILVGQYMVVAETDDKCQSPGLGYIMTNWLKVTAIEDTSNRGRRGANRNRLREAETKTLDVLFR